MGHPVGLEAALKVEDVTQSCSPGVRVPCIGLGESQNFKLGSGLNGLHQDDSQRSQHFLHHVRQASEVFVAVSVGSRELEKTRT